jgi:hypothetical protein
MNLLVSLLNRKRENRKKPTKTSSCASACEIDIVKIDIHCYYMWDQTVLSLNLVADESWGLVVMQRR